MDILVTGGAGFLGQRLISALLERSALVLDGTDRSFERIICFDTVEGAIADPRVVNVAGSIADAASVDALVGPQTRVVFHLAAVVSGTAEADFDLGMRVNVDGTRNLLEACRTYGDCPRLLFSSTLAVFGGDLPEIVTDATTPTPQGSYGVQKLIGELLVQDYTRKGFVDGRSVRVPTVVVRPGAPNGAASGFASGIVREPLAGREVLLPVELSTQMIIASPRAVVAMLLHAVGLPAQSWGWNRSLNLPGLTVSMRETLDALRRVGGDAAAALVKDHPDESVRALVRTWPARFDAARARALGFAADADIDAVVAAYAQDHPEAVVMRP